MNLSKMEILSVCGLNLLTTEDNNTRPTIKWCQTVEIIGAFEVDDRN